MAKTRKKRYCVASSYLLIIAWLGLRFDDRKYWDKSPDETSIDNLKNLLEDE
jgi:hypothetical protein